MNLIDIIFIIFALYNFRFYKLRFIFSIKILIKTVLYLCVSIAVVQSSTYLGLEKSSYSNLFIFFYFSNMVKRGHTISKYTTIVESRSEKCSLCLMRLQNKRYRNI